MVWLTLLPFALWDIYGWASPGLQAIISFLLIGVENIGIQIEEPFAVRGHINMFQRQHCTSTWLNRFSWGCLSQVLPMSVYCSTIRKDVDEVLANTHGACFCSMRGLEYKAHAASDRYLVHLTRWTQACGTRAGRGGGSKAARGQWGGAACGAAHGNAQIGSGCNTDRLSTSTSCNKLTTTCPGRAGAQHHHCLYRLLHGKHANKVLVLETGQWEESCHMLR